MARIVLITHPVDGAEEFARQLVERRLAACVNLSSVTSVYRWEGAVQSDPEVLLIAKTDAARVPEIEAFLVDGHPYDVPELVALEPAHVENTYLGWLTGQVGPAQSDASGSRP